MKYKHTLVVEYDGPLSPPMDEKIRKTVKGVTGGSGFCFLDGGVRDLSFLFRTSKDANDAKNRLMKAEIPGVRSTARADK